MGYIAFFDLDHTIVRVNSGEALLRQAHKKRILSTSKLFNALFLALLYKLKIIDPATIIEKLGGWLTGYPVESIEKLCGEIVEKDLIPAIRPEIICEIKKHKQQGAELVILSSAIASICNPLAKYLEMGTVISSELEVVDQKYTGHPLGKFCFREEKLNRISSYFESKNYKFEDAFYYADSIDDLPVLQSVGHPVCINPDRRLRKIAQKRNWVIYNWA